MYGNLYKDTLLVWIKFVKKKQQPICSFLLSVSYFSMQFQNKPKHIRQQNEPCDINIFKSKNRNRPTLRQWIIWTDFHLLLESHLGQFTDMRQVSENANVYWTDCTNNSPVYMEPLQ